MMNQKIICFAMLALTCQWGFPQALQVMNGVPGDAGEAPVKKIELFKKDGNFIEVMDAGIKSESFFDRFQGYFGHTNYDKLVPVKSKTSGKSKHITYHQYYKNYKIFNASITLHESNGYLKNITGRVIPNLNVNTNVYIDEQTALARALNYIKDKEFEKHGLPDADKIILDESNPYRSELGLSKTFGESDEKENYRLSYLLTISTTYPYKKGYCATVDAQNGRVLDVYSPALGGQVTTLFNGLQNVTTTWSGNVLLYRLIDNTRGQGIETRKLNHNFINDLDDDWDDANDKKAAASAHWAAGKAWDYYYGRFSRWGMNNLGQHVYIEMDQPNANFGNISFLGPNGEWMIGLQQANTGTNIERVSLNSVGHEITHGVCRTDANWTAMSTTSETGALMEGYCDLFGEFLEYYVKGTADWKFADEEWLDITKMRCFFPPVFNGLDALYYGDANWNAHNDQHDRGGVLRHWAHMLAVGGTGQNHVPNSFCVKPIGISEVERLLYAVLNQGYLNNSSTYNDMRNASITVAQGFYGMNSEEVANITAAWYAVNVGSNYTGNVWPTSINQNGTSSVHYNNAIEMFGGSFSSTSHLDMSSNTEIMIPGPVADFNLGSDIQLYIAPACAGGARVANTGDADAQEIRDGASTESVSKNDFDLLATDPENGFAVIPNPTNGKFKISVNRSIEYPQLIQVSDALGKTVLEIKSPSAFESEVDLSDYKEGLYIVKVNYENKLVTKKIVKN
jgi:Zn-dependent metalloprotease